MDSNQIRQAYLEFFKTKGHAVIPAAPLVPQDDPTTLFTSSGMQQLIPYLKGETHPMGKRLVDSQPCFRAEDILEVGDNRHTTYFEMLGNWSLGDYFKAEQLVWFWEFLTQVLNLDPNRLYVSIFIGSSAAPKDTESYKIWQKLGVPEDHLFYYPAEKNWWSRSGTPENMPPGEIGGPDSEVFFEFTQVKHDPKFGPKCHPNCDCGRFLEIGNSVFIQYEKQPQGTFRPLPQKNVDFGGGLERLTAASQDQPDIFKTDIFQPMIQHLEIVTGKKYQGLNRPAMRVISDHLRAAKAMIDEGLEPSNKQQGYILRRLIRRSAVKMRDLKGDLNPADFPAIFQPEISKFKSTLTKGLNLINKTPAEKINEAFAFNLFQTYGFPFEITQEILKEKQIVLDSVKFSQLLKQHSDQSRIASAGMFKSGLADHSEIVTKYHTATHLLHAALRKILGNHVHQAGSNITSDRLRFDFTHHQPLTQTQVQKIESLVNQKIKADLPVTKTIMAKEAALKSGALAFFKQTYPEQVSVYSIGNFSRELCGGPHVSSTGEIGGVKIIKEESVGTGKRRLYAVIENGTKKPAHQI